MKKVALIILDGFALGDPDSPSNAYAQANAPFLDTLFTENSVALLKTHGECVGLPEFQVGGSEVGHSTIGSGRVVKHVLTKINDQIESGEFFENPILKELFTKAKSRGKIHFVGLTSDGGIHSFTPHLFGLQRMAKQYDIPEVYVHAILDGRDVGVRTAKEYLQHVEDQPNGTIATIGGRYFAMDRDQNWDRVEKHYQVMTDPDQKSAEKPWSQIIDEHYQNSDESDYYLPPALLDKRGQIGEDDIVICFNFRTDRMRQIMQAFCAPDEKFSGNFPRKFVGDPENFGIFGNYYPAAQVVYSLSSTHIPNTLGEVLSKHGKTQLRVAETEKMKHVTFFFSGEYKDLFTGEERIIVPSSGVPNYANDPKMSAHQQADKLLDLVEQKKSADFILQNFANGDMVGHSGDLNGAIKAVETLDEEMAREVPKLLRNGYHVIVTADHGNCEIMTRADGSPHASHTKTLVPCVILSPDGTHFQLREKGTLADLAPTVLDIMELLVPSEMTGKDLIR